MTEPSRGRSGATSESDLESLLLGLEGGRVGVWRWDCRDGSLFWSRNLEEIHDLPPGTFDGTFSFFQSDIHVEDRDRVMRAIEAAIATGDRYQVEYRLSEKQGRPMRWIEARGHVLREGGETVGLAGVCQDISDRKFAERELAQHACQQEAVARLGQLALSGTDRQTLYETVSREIAEVLGVEVTKLLEWLPGGEDLLLRAGHGFDAEQIGIAKVGAERASQAGFALSTGVPVVVEDLAEETRFRPADLLLDRGVVSGISVVIAGEGGRAYGVLGAHSTRRRKFRQSDIDFLQAVANVVALSGQRQKAREAQELLIRELRHRVGNLLSLIMSLFNNTATTVSSVEDLQERFQARLMALSRSHALVSGRGWTTADIEGLIAQVMEPYLDRVVMSGAPCEMPADRALALSLALHELATNAAKYGALSQPGGRVVILWEQENGGERPAIRIDWQEEGGPSVTAPASRGFGTRLVTTVIERQLLGRLSAEFAPDGLKVAIAVPVNDPG